MIYRFMFVGYTENIKSVKIIAAADCYVALSYKNNKVFMYVEANKEYVDPDVLADGDLIPYPHGKKWERANEIFHYSKPMTEEQWSRKIDNKKPHVAVNQLKPDKISSYIFYHYQYQEEVPGDGDRYGIIYLHGEQLIFYLEDPTERETEEMAGLLNTKNSPLEQWQEIMEEHFADRWRNIDILEFSQYCKFNATDELL